MNLLKGNSSWNGLIYTVPKVGLPIDWNLERMWPAVSAMEIELKSDQVKKVGQVMLPNYLEEVEAFFFSQWVVFGSLMMCLCPILRSRGRVDIGQASLTSKAQVSLDMWNSLMKMFGSLKWEWWICWSFNWNKYIWWSMLKLKVEGSLVRVPGIWGASVANQDSPFSFWIFIELAPSNMINC